ncbi:MAG TPA: GrpB family protein [Paenibacillus sp.]|nr:GrpB family protein [Paenibacillus sp.]
MREEIAIVAYDPAWAEQFNEEKARLLALLGSEAKAIEHVGSTAIPGQAAKPIIDMFVAVTPFRDDAAYSTRLGPATYRYLRTGMTERHLFSKFTNGIWTHNVHILPYSVDFHDRNELLFRDFLRRRPALVRRYEEAKRRASQEAGGDMEAYTRLKTGFIQEVVDAARAERGLPPQDVWTNEPKSESNN